MPKKVSKRKGPGRVGPARSAMWNIVLAESHPQRGMAHRKHIHTLALEHFKDR